MAKRKVRPLATPSPWDPEREALISAIIDNPREDTPLLVYADWQDEHDRPEHAEFIRLECELEALRGSATVERRKEIRLRLRELKQHPDLKFTKGYRRGFLPSFYIDTIQSRWRDPTDIEAQIPFDRILALSLNLRADPSVIATVAHQPWLGRVTNLWLVGTGLPKVALPPGGLKPLCESPHLSRLEEFRLGEFAAVSADEWAELVLAPAATRLWRVSLHDTRFPKGGLFEALDRVAHSERAEQLSSLVLMTPAPSETELRMLLTSPRLGNLRQLYYPGKQLSASGLTVLRNRFGSQLLTY